MSGPAAEIRPGLLVTPESKPHEHGLQDFFGVGTVEK